MYINKVALLSAVITLNSAVAWGAEVLSRPSAAKAIQAHFATNQKTIHLLLGDGQGHVIVRCAGASCNDGSALLGSLPPDEVTLLRNKLIEFREVRRIQDRIVPSQAVIYYQLRVAASARDYLVREYSGFGYNKSEVKIADVDSIEVTGVTPPADMQGMRVSLAMFTIKYKPNLVGQALAATERFAQSGRAKFVLFDDGWRLDSVNLQ